MAIDSAVTGAIWNDILRERYIVFNIDWDGYVVKRIHILWILYARRLGHKVNAPEAPDIYQAT